MGHNSGNLRAVGIPWMFLRLRCRLGQLMKLLKLAKLRSEGNIWVSLPGEVDTWWRQRREMKLVANGQGWMIEGAGSERACIAYASLDRDRLVYQID